MRPSALQWARGCCESRLHERRAAAPARHLQGSEGPGCLSAAGSLQALGRSQERLEELTFGAGSGGASQLSLACERAPSRPPPRERSGRTHT